MPALPSLPANRRRIAVLGGSVLAIGVASLWAWHDNIQTFATGLTQKPNPASSLWAAYSPPSTPELDAVTFEPPHCNLLFGIPFVYAQMVDGQIHVDEGKDILPYGTGRPTKPIWRGPITEAKFTHEMIGGADTLKDQSGKILWTNNAALSSPDLHLQSTASGEARLLGKKGNLLWAGILPEDRKDATVNGHGGSPSIAAPAQILPKGSPSKPLIHNCGVLITCVKETKKTRVFHGLKVAETVNGFYRVADNDGKLLWSGTLPARPVILLRQGNRFSFQGRNGGGSGQDRITFIRFALDQGKVSATKNGVDLGSRPVGLLKTFERTVWKRAKDNSDFAFPETATTYLSRPRNSGKAGDQHLNFTYKDSTGKRINTLQMPPAAFTQTAESNSSKSSAEKMD
jgi:hypothetical protein